jgi:hypothetical protein
MYGDLPFGMFTLPNATLRGDEAYIFTSDGSPIMEQNADFLRKKKFLKPKLPEDHHHLRSPYEVEQLVSLISRCDTGFFHWIMDSLPKVLIAEACGFIGSYLLPSSTTAPWADESLFLLGISMVLLAGAEKVAAHRRGGKGHLELDVRRALRRAGGRG